jgi:hypothetical protein
MNAFGLRMRVGPGSFAVLRRSAASAAQDDT